MSEPVQKPRLLVWLGYLITLLAIVMIVVSAYVLYDISAYGGKSFVVQLVGGYEAIEPYITWLYLSIPLGVLLLVIGVGFVKGMFLSWFVAFAVALILTGYNAYVLYSTKQYSNFVSLIQLGIGIVLLIYLLTPGVLRYYVFKGRKSRK